MTLLIFSGLLLVGMLLSDLAHRSVLSIAVLFLAVGFVSRIFGWVPDTLHAMPTVRWTAEFALLSILFSDGMRSDLRMLVRGWSLPARALFIGMPLTILAIAVATRWLTALPWLDCFLLGTLLGPTDPVFAAAIVGREEVPARLRSMLNIESGLNDGLALPVVLALVALAAGSPLHLAGFGREVIQGVAIGLLVPWAAISVTKTPILLVHERFSALYVLSIGLLVFALAKATGSNEFLAAFMAGASLATSGPELADEFRPHGEVITELFKLAAVFIFGTSLSVPELAAVWPAGYVLAAFSLLVARPVALALSLAASPLSAMERFSAAWFGPKGFSSVVYSLLVLQAGIPNGLSLFHLAAVVIGVSMILHSSTDVPIARYFARRQNR